MVMKIQILTIKKFLGWTIAYFFSSNQFGSQERWKLLFTSVFKRMEKHWKKAIRHIIGDFEISSFSDEFDGE